MPRFAADILYSHGPGLIGNNEQYDQLSGPAWADAMADISEGFRELAADAGITPS